MSFTLLYSQKLLPGKPSLVVPNQRLPALSCILLFTLSTFCEPWILISFGCPVDIIFDSLTFSFGKSFLTCPLQEVTANVKARKIVQSNSYRVMYIILK